MKIKSLPEEYLMRVLADLNITNEKHCQWAVQVLCKARDQTDVASDYKVTKQAVHRVISKVRDHIGAVAAPDNVTAEAVFLLPMSLIASLERFEQVSAKSPVGLSAEAVQKLNAVLTEQIRFLEKTK